MFQSRKRNHMFPSEFMYIEVHCHLLGAIMSKLIHLIFNYRSSLVGLELTPNICEGRGVLMVSWKYFNKQNIERSFKMKKLSQNLKNSVIKVIEPEQNTKPND